MDPEEHLDLEALEALDPLSPHAIPLDRTLDFDHNQPMAPPFVLDYQPLPSQPTPLDEPGHKYDLPDTVAPHDTIRTAPKPQSQGGAQWPEEETKPMPLLTNSKPDATESTQSATVSSERTGMAPPSIKSRSNNSVPASTAARLSSALPGPPARGRKGRPRSSSASNAKYKHPRELLSTAPPRIICESLVSAPISTAARLSSALPDHPAPSRKGCPRSSVASDAKYKSPSEISGMAPPSLKSRSIDSMPASTAARLFSALPDPPARPKGRPRSSLASTQKHKTARQLLELPEGKTGVTTVTHMAGRMGMGRPELREFAQHDAESARRPGPIKSTTTSSMKRKLVEVEDDGTNVASVAPAPKRKTVNRYSSVSSADELGDDRN